MTEKDKQEQLPERFVHSELLSNGLIVVTFKCFELATTMLMTPETAENLVQDLMHHIDKTAKPEEEKVIVTDK